MCNALTVTKRESAPLPERLCERIAYCAILLTVSKHLLMRHKTSNLPFLQPQSHFLVAY